MCVVCCCSLGALCFDPSASSRKLSTGQVFALHRRSLLDRKLSTGQFFALHRRSLLDRKLSTGQFSPDNESSFSRVVEAGSQRTRAQKNPEDPKRTGHQPKNCKIKDLNKAKEKTRQANTSNCNHFAQSSVCVCVSEPCVHI